LRDIDLENLGRVLVKLHKVCEEEVKRIDALLMQWNTIRRKTGYPVKRLIDAEEIEQIDNVSGKIVIDRKCRILEICVYSMPDMVHGTQVVVTYDKESEAFYVSIDYSPYSERNMVDLYCLLQKLRRLHGLLREKFERYIREIEEYVRSLQEKKE